MTAQKLVLIGGGHAHIEVLRRIAVSAWPSVDVTLISAGAYSYYSGMITGFVAGEYAPEECAIDLNGLSQRAGARFVDAVATRIDATNRIIELDHGSSLPYDVASVDIGASVSAMEGSGVREHALPTRPISSFVSGARSLLREMASSGQAGRPFRLAVVGAGAGGVELAFAFRSRLPHRERDSVVLVDAGKAPLAGHGTRVSRRVRRLCTRSAIELQLGRRVLSVHSDGLHFSDGSREPADAVVWVAGAGAPPFFRVSGLATDPIGFLRVRDTLQALEHDDLFAVGDAAHLEGHPDTPKAGVYAVRQAPVLATNLLARLQGGRLRSYRPQRDFLMILNLGAGHALATKWGWTLEGRGVRWVKDVIDRRFVERYQPAAR